MVAKVAVHFNLFPDEGGLLVVPFCKYDEANLEAEEIGRFVIPWHELHDLIGRMERIERMKLDDDITGKTF